MRKKKLFESLDGGNRFKLIRESDWAHTQEHNDGINGQRRMLRAMGQYIEKASKSPTANEEIIEVAKAAAADIKTLDTIISHGYLDSGYRYDDKDPRNQADLHGDRNFDADIERQRSGTTKEDEIEAEIRQQVAQRHLDDRMEYYKQFFSRELAAQLFPDESEPMSLADYMSEIAGYEQEAAWDAEHDDQR